VAAGGIVGTASTLVKCNDLQTATRRATEDRELVRSVFSNLRGTAWQASFTTLHGLAAQPAGQCGIQLAGGRTETVSFPDTDLATVLANEACTGSRFRDIDGDGTVDLDPASTAPGLVPVRVTIERAGRTVSYFSLVRTP
jgi:hypothetical protein